MTDFLLVAPMLVPLAGGVLLVATWGRVTFARVISILVASAVAALALHTLFMVRDDGILASSLGNWPGPFGIPSGRRTPEPTGRRRGRGRKRPKHTWRHTKRWARL